MLPKLASEEFMASVSTTPSLQDMVKAAMSNAASQVSVALEANRQASVENSKLAAETCKSCGKSECKCEKTASVTTEYAEKFASALEFALPFLKEATPGEGPNALHVMEATSTGTLPENHGQAHAQPPMHPAAQKSSPQGPATQVQNDKDRAPGGPGEMVHKNASISKLLNKLAESSPKLEKKETEGMVEAEKGLAKAEAAHKKENEEEKKASSIVTSDLVDFALAHIKKASEKIAADGDDASISAGKAVPPGTSAAGEAGGAPVGGPPQGPTGLVGSNDAAINYNKNQAYANRKVDMKKYLNEPMMTSSTDSTLKDVLVHDGAKDNNKMASEAAIKTASARALLARLAEEEKKLAGAAS